MKAWLWFAIVQIVMLLATALGWFVLIPFCLARAWMLDAKSIKDGRPIDQWTWSPLNWIYGNPEDGVSGMTALVWVDGSQSLYMPNGWAPWRAYCWSALRNSCDNLKYVFHWSKGPSRRWENGSFYLEAGWNTSGLPVLSMGRI